MIRIEIVCLILVISLFSVINVEAHSIRARQYDSYPYDTEDWGYLDWCYAYLEETIKTTVRKFDENVQNLAQWFQVAIIDNLMEEDPSKLH